MTPALFQAIVAAPGFSLGITCDEDEITGIEFLELRDGRWKLHPIADWDDIDVATYALQHDLPEHPLSRQGYVSVGVVHTTAPLRDGDAAKTRFFGLTRECGLHFDTQDSVAA